MAPRPHADPSDTVPQTPPFVWDYSICRPSWPEHFRKSCRNHSRLCSNSHSQTWCCCHPEQQHNPPIELTVPTNTPEGLQEACRWKQLKPNYLALLNDRPQNIGFQSALETIEVGTLGLFNNQTIASLHALLPNLRKNSVHRLLLGPHEQTSVSCSALIFNGRLSSSWTSTPFAHPSPPPPPPPPPPPITNHP